MLWIAPPHVAPHVGPAAAPEAGQVGGDWQPAGPPGTAAQPATAHGLPQTRGFRQTVERLRACGHDRHGLRVVDRSPRALATRDAQAAQQSSRTRQSPTAAGRAGWRARRAGQVRQAVTCPPRCGASHSCTLAFSASSDRSGQPVVGLYPPHQRHTGLKLACRIGPGQRPQPIRRHGDGPVRPPHRRGPPVRCDRPGPARRTAGAAARARHRKTGSKLVSTCSVKAGRRWGSVSGSSGAASLIRAAAFSSSAATANSGALASGSARGNRAPSAASQPKSCRGSPRRCAMRSGGGREQPPRVAIGRAH